jgi:predicted ester cyclase
MFTAERPTTPWRNAVNNPLSRRSVIRIGAAAATAAGIVGAASPASAHGSTPHLVDSWLKLWNGDYAQASRSIAQDFRVHAALMDGGDGSAINTPAALVGWIAQTRAALPDLRFTIQVGPIIDGDRIALRWRARGTYSGGMPGAAAPIGTRVDFTGTDLLRVRHGRLAEYWVNTDVHVLLAQLQVAAP